MFEHYRWICGDELKIGWPNWSVFDHSNWEWLFFFPLRVFRSCECCENTFAYTHTLAHTKASGVFILTIYGLNSIDCTYVPYVRILLCLQFAFKWMNETEAEKSKKKNIFFFWLFYVVCCAYHCIVYVHDIDIHKFFCCVFIAKLL